MNIDIRPKLATTRQVVVDTYQFSKDALRAAKFWEWLEEHPKMKRAFIWITIYGWGLALSRIIDVIFKSGRLQEVEFDKLIPLLHEFIH